MSPGIHVRVVTVTCLWILYTDVTCLPQAKPDDATSQPDSSVNFYIYPTPDSVDTPIVDDPGVLQDGQPLTIVIHGFKGDHTARSMNAIKEALLMSGASNVVVMDWSILADDPSDSALTAYHEVRDKGVAEAAAQAAAWISMVMGSKSISPEDVHLVGFSLGAHVSGIIGQNLNNSLGRITGLDPPKFGYEKIHKQHRLDKGDAMFVNAIHTSGGILSYTEKDPIGHVDFFPNGDTVPQKGCPYENPIDIITCSHYMAFALFAESIFHKNALIATACDTWASFNKGHCKNGTQAPMGYATPPTTRGKFFTSTKSKPPYGEEDPENPLPDNIKRLLVYNTSEAFIQPKDVVNFLTHKDKKDTSMPLADDPGAGDSGVMKVKGGSKTTTTPDPPAFQNSGSSLLADALGFIATSLAGYEFVQLLWSWWSSR
ncbi:lipase member H-like isoform X1 [Macrosteles quadrilineatus]|uniref:lipase member H-like isoform X1 n=1 Tax=Macrosteles quadrilineatus TaxID=74068 RepID=UPI0023E1743C|nr:lipase member H-like isoform X1 [Macrosteles quadrilineatus]